MDGFKIFILIWLAIGIIGAIRNRLRKRNRYSLKDNIASTIIEAAGTCCLGPFGFLAK